MGGRDKDAMQRAFGDFPIELDDSDIGTLKGIAAALDSAEYLQLIEAIYKYGAVRIQAQY